MKQLFSDNYFQARSDFLVAASASSAEVKSFPIKATGPQGQELFIDVAWLGKSDAKKVVLHISGTHGVEGFVGSAIQRAILQEGVKHPEDCAVVMLHCLNPWGMAHLRRVNESNVDLNRNLRLDGKFSGATAAYKEINNFLNPVGEPFHFDFFLIRALWLVWRLGLQNFVQAVAGGQCDFPKGLYFAGQIIEESNLILSNWVKTALQSVEQCVAIEVHSGLGNFGQQTLFTNLKLSDPHSKKMAEIYGQELSSDDPKEGIGFRTPGDLMNSVPAMLPAARVSWILQEFGTLPKIEVLKALRAENQYHHYACNVDLNHWSKINLKETFNPPDIGWREKVVAMGVDLFAKTMKSEDVWQ